VIYKVTIGYGCVDRRTLLWAIGSSAVAVGGLNTASGAAANQSNEPTVAIEDQRVDDKTLTIERVTTDVEGQVFVQDQPEEGQNTIFVEVDVSPESEEPLTVELDTEIETSQMIEAWLIDGDRRDGDFDLLDIDEAFVSVDDNMDPDDFGVKYIEPAAGDEFNYPYYLYTPVPEGDVDEEKPILVEPNNTGQVADDLELHRERAEELVDGGGISRDISDTLTVPLLVPVFPRPESEPRDWSHYIHALDDTSVSIEDGPLERVDLQLLRMTEHAKNVTLADTQYSFTDQLILNGFSASGNFVDRFTVLHPERVLSVTAGGLNGMPLLPAEEFDGQALPYHVGIEDVAELTGEEVDLEALDETNQFLYMGAEDDNDTMPFDDAWTDDDLRELALDVYGEDMITERFPTAQEAYQEVGVEAQFRVYPDAGHTPRPAAEDIVEFHRRSIEGENVSELGENLTANVSIDVSVETASPGEEIVFDGSDSEGPAGTEIVAYQWESETGLEGTGESVNFAFEYQGEFTVTLTVVTDRGNTHQATTTIEIIGEDGETDAGDVPEEDDNDAPDSTGDETDEEDDNASDGSGEVADASDDTPGFGIGGAIAGIGGATYLFRQRLTDEESHTN